jgi:hypothetical protein
MTGLSGKNAMPGRNWKEMKAMRSDDKRRAERLALANG